MRSVGKRRNCELIVFSRDLAFSPFAIFHKTFKMKSFILFAAVLLVACATQPNIWPLPKEYKMGEQTVTVDGYHFRFYTPAQSNELMEAFQRYYNIIFDRRSEIIEGDALRNVKVTVKEDKTELQLGIDESYTLEIPESGEATITAANVFGAMHGLETFSQLVEFDVTTGTYVIRNAPWVINDAPRFPHRGRESSSRSYRGKY